MDRSDLHVILLNEACGGGVMRHTIDLYHGLIQRKIQVTIVLSPHRLEDMYRSELDAIDPAHIVYVPMKRSVHWHDAKAILHLRTILKQADGRIVLHAQSTKAALLGIFLRDLTAASVVTPHSYRGLDSSLRGPAKMIVRTAERIYSHAYDRVIAVVQAEMEYAASLGVPPAHLHLVPNAVAIDKNCFPHLRGARNNLPAVPTLGFVGRLASQKNPLLFVETLRAVLDAGVEVKGLMLGSGQLMDATKERARALGVADKIEWRGEVAAKPALPEMDIMLHTSNYEALPYSIIEACAALLPVVATSNPGSQAILGQDLPGNIIPLPDPQLMAAKVLALLKDRQLRLRQMDALEAIALRYSGDTMTDRIVEIYRSLEPSGNATNPLPSSW